MCIELIYVELDFAEALRKDSNKKDEKPAALKRAISALASARKYSL